MPFIVVYGNILLPTKQHPPISIAKAPLQHRRSFLSALRTIVSRHFDGNRNSRLQTGAARADSRKVERHHRRATGLRFRPGAGFASLTAALASSAIGAAF